MEEQPAAAGKKDVKPLHAQQVEDVEDKKHRGMGNGLDTKYIIIMKRDALKKVYEDTGRHHKEFKR